MGNQPWHHGTDRLQKVKHVMFNMQTPKEEGLGKPRQCGTHAWLIPGSPKPQNSLYILDANTLFLMKIKPSL